MPFLALSFPFSVVLFLFFLIDIFLFVNLCFKKVFFFTSQFFLSHNAKKYCRCKSLLTDFPRHFPFFHSFMSFHVLFFLKKSYFFFILSSIPLPFVYRILLLIWLNCVEQRDKNWRKKDDWKNTFLLCISKQNAKHTLRLMCFHDKRRMHFMCDKIINFCSCQCRWHRHMCRKNTMKIGIYIIHATRLSLFPFLHTDEIQ